MKKKALEIYDCCMRKQTVEDRAAKDSTYQLLGKLMKSDPCRPKQKPALISTLRELNSRLCLGVDLNFPSPKPKAKSEETDGN